MNDGIIITPDENGVWGIKEEPYATIEIATKRELDEINELLKLGKKYRELKSKGGIDNE